MWRDFHNNWAVYLCNALLYSNEMNVTWRNKKSFQLEWGLWKGFPASPCLEHLVLHMSPVILIWGCEWSLHLSIHCHCSICKMRKVFSFASPLFQTLCVVGVPKPFNLDGCWMSTLTAVNREFSPGFSAHETTWTSPLFYENVIWCCEKGWVDCSSKFGLFSMIREGK